MAENKDTRDTGRPSAFTLVAIFLIGVVALLIAGSGEPYSSKIVHENDSFKNYSFDPICTTEPHRIDCHASLAYDKNPRDVAYIEVQAMNIFGETQTWRFPKEYHRTLITEIHTAQGNNHELTLSDEIHIWIHKETGEKQLIQQHTFTCHDLINQTEKRWCKQTYNAGGAE